MRCNICDKTLNTPRYNRELKRWEPCEPCLEIIYDTLGEFKDQAVWVEEDVPSLVSEEFPNTLEKTLDNGL